MIAETNIFIKYDNAEQLKIFISSTFSNNVNKTVKFTPVDCKSLVN